MFYRFAVTVVVIAIVVAFIVPTRRLAPAPTPALVAVAAAPDAPISSGETVVRRQPNGHFYVDGTVNGQPVHFLVDTGATTVVLTPADASRVGLQFSPSEFRQVGYGAGGALLGKPVMLDTVALGDNQVSQVRGVVLADAPGLNASLLGQSYLERVRSVQISGDQMAFR